MEDKRISFQWETGHIDIMLSSVLDMSPAELKKFVNAATVNGEEVKAEIADYIRPIAQRNENETSDNRFNKFVSNAKKLMAIVENRKLTKAEKIVQKLFKNRHAYSVICTGIFENAGKYCATDGYRLFRFSAPLSSDIPTIANSMDTAKAYGDISAYSVAMGLPTVKEIKDTIKLLKSGACRGVLNYGKFHAICSGKHVDVNYDFGYGLPLVNAEYLLDMLEVFPDCKAFCAPGNAIRPVYFVSGDNDGLILPVRKTEEYEDAPLETTSEVTETTETAAATADTTETAVETVKSTAEAATEAETETPQDTSTADGDGADNAIADVTEIVVIHPLAIAYLSAIKSDSDCFVNDSEAYTGDSIAGNINSHLKRNTACFAHSEETDARPVIVAAYSPFVIIHPKTYTPPGPEPCLTCSVSISINL